MSEDGRAAQGLLRLAVGSLTLGLLTIPFNSATKPYDGVSSTLMLIGFLLLAGWAIARSRA